MRAHLCKDTVGWNDPGWAMVLVGGSAALVVHYLGPLLSMLPPCVFHTLTGMPCPTCGSTRAFAALVDGNLLAALRIQPLFAIGCLIAIGLGALAVAARITGARITVALTERDRFLIRWTLIAAVLINWVYLLSAGI